MMGHPTVAPRGPPSTQGSPEQGGLGSLSVPHPQSACPLAALPFHLAPTLWKLCPAGPLLLSPAGGVGLLTKQGPTDLPQQVPAGTPKGVSETDLAHLPGIL